MSVRAKHFLLAPWAGVSAQIAGRILDGIWHGNYDEFEGAPQQLEAHWLLWIGVLLTLAVAWRAIVRLPGAEPNGGYALVLVGGALYVPVSVWHFVEHANHNDQEFAHYLLAPGQLAMIVGGAFLGFRRSAAST